MSNYEFIKPEHVWLKDEPSLTEAWVQDQIALDPAILGLGDLVLKDKERRQPRAGRLDLLLQDPDSNRRYELELQLGKCDESHIIRTIEYWDVERKRFPQYDHCAVLVAEDITSRFLNVIGLFNGHIPLIALQMRALRFENKIALVFTTVLDELTLGLEEEEDQEQSVTDRHFWETRATKATVALADRLLELVRTFEPSMELKYNKFYIGLAKDGAPDNFVVFKPKKNNVRIEARLTQANEVEQDLDAAGLDVMDYDKRWGRYRTRLTKEDIERHSDALTKLMRRARDRSAE